MLLCQSVGNQAAEVLRTTTAVVCCLRQKRVGLRSAEAAWLIASVSSADTEASSAIDAGGAPRPRSRYLALRLKSASNDLPNYL